MKWRGDKLILVQTWFHVVVAVNTTNK